MIKAVTKELARAKKTRSEIDLVRLRIDETRGITQDLEREIESQKRIQESEIKLFFADIIAKVKDREHEVLQIAHDEFQFLAQGLNDNKLGLDEQLRSITKLMVKFDKLGNGDSCYDILSKVQ